MAITVLYAEGWRVESAVLDRDGTGERTWNLAVDPDGAEYWRTTSGLQELLHRHGLDVGDLTLAPPASIPVPSRLTDPHDECE
ncbi:hypothetical protein ACFO1B_43890 [Dactylosporangium siamense]|uniref:Uncharacterized protein n=1 Tax=Dactylosporangium siamense TaxID=685454 RepID=A0A919PZD7_9ACTN|nr:hypothetical protein [Dactylosporangium siamense]GIG53161.1 hypothetical protein Dsi01nite_112020 [Dactylosporangium siamense]